jgi:predicted nucleic acid-binding protein
VHENAIVDLSLANSLYSVERKRLMPWTVYVETSIISYLAAQPSRDLVTAAHQQITHDWWQRRRAVFDLFVSQLVIDEAAAGDPDAAARRSALIAGFPLLDVTHTVTAFAAFLSREIALPSRAGADALHIAIATVHGMDYLLTWNCTHIANAELRRLVERACKKRGYMVPVMCTPEELMEEVSHDNSRKK